MSLMVPTMSDSVRAVPTTVAPASPRTLAMPSPTPFARAGDDGDLTVEAELLQCHCGLLFLPTGGTVELI